MFFICYLLPVGSVEGGVDCCEIVGCGCWMIMFHSALYCCVFKIEVDRRDFILDSLCNHSSSLSEPSSVFYIDFIGTHKN